MSNYAKALSESRTTSFKFKPCACSHWKNLTQRHFDFVLESLPDTLVYLDLSFSGILTISTLKPLCKALRRMKNLQVLSLGLAFMAYKSFDELPATLEAMHKLEKLDLDVDQNDDEDPDYPRGPVVHVPQSEVNALVQSD